MVQGSLNPNITFLGEKLWPVAWNKIFTYSIWGKKLKDKKGKNENFEKTTLKSTFLGQKVCSIARVQTDRHTHRQTHTEINTEDCLSGFQDFFLQSIMKDRSNNFFSSFLLCPSHAGTVLPFRHRVGLILTAASVANDWKKKLTNQHIIRGIESFPSCDVISLQPYQDLVTGWQGHHRGREPTESP